MRRETSSVHRHAPLRRRAPLLLALGVAALAAVAVASTPSRSVTSPRLNVVVILSDDERSDSNARMRNVQSLLAAHGVTFTRYFATTSECCPSRASILTGQYSHHTGVIENFGLPSYPRFDESSTLAVWLRSAGYETALVGKYLNDYTVYGNHRVPPGWSDWKAIDSRPEERYYDYVLNENGRLVHYGAKPADYGTTVLATKATDFLDRASEPFFLYFAPIAPHLPATPAPRDVGSIPVPKTPTVPSFNERDLTDKPWLAWHKKGLSKGAIRFLNRDIRRKQLESLRELDRSVRRIVNELERRHVLDRTVILYASDNGFLWGEHRLGGKIWPYEESIHVPLVVRTPWATGSSTDDHLVLNIDLASTIAELAGVRPGLPQDGTSLVPLLRGRPVPWRHDFVVEYLGRSQLGDGGPPPFKAIRTTRWLYVEYLNGWRELYDLRLDRWELRNRASDPALVGLRQRLHDRLAALYGRAPVT